MSFLKHFPDAWVQEDSIFWGNALNPQTWLSRGVRVEVPDLRTADNRTILDLRLQNAYLLSCLTSQDAMQIHWSVEDDYYADLKEYDDRTDELMASGKLRRFSKEMRLARSLFYRSQLRSGGRRRERMYYYVASKMKDAKPRNVPSLKAANAYLTAQRAAMASKLDQMRAGYTLSKWEDMDSDAQLNHMYRVLNPALASKVAENTRFTGELDKNRSIRELCLRSDIVPFTYGYGEDGGTTAPVGLYWQGNYNAFFVITRLPGRTRPGMWIPVFDSNERNCTVVQNIYPLAISDEVNRLRKEIEELSKFLTDPKSIGAGKEIQNKRARIDALMDGSTMPFKTLTVVRVWADTLEGVNNRAISVAGALTRLDGCEFLQVNDPVRARHLFYQTLPGNLGDSYRGWDNYVENNNLVDWMPISSTFTGHLGLGKDSVALLDSPGGGIVGLRLTANGSPQHTSVTGATGAGKTVLLIEWLSQMEAEIDYLYIQEEGMAFAPYAMVRGLPSIVLRDTSQVTLNPFDTFGLPLSSGNIATVSKIAMKIVGLSADGDRNARRENLIGEYVAALYKDTAEAVKMTDEDRWYNLTRRALLADKLRTANDDFRDGYLALGQLEKRDPARVQEMIEKLSEPEVNSFMTAPMTRELVSSLVFTTLKPEEYPQWSTLVSVMKNARFSHHKSGAVADDLNYLVSDLARGKRSGGSIGPLIDGPTNVNLHGPGLHFDTSFLSEGLLKSIAGFLFPEMVRKHTMSLPRGQLKVMMLDELRRLLLIPGAGEHVKEMLAQMRKYKTTMIGAFQGPSQIDEIDPALTTLIFGQCKQHIMMRQNSSAEIQRIAAEIGLPGAGQRAVARHPLIEHQRGPVKASYFTLFSRDGNAPTCGTVRVESHPYLVWLASSNGDVFDRKQAALKTYADPVDGIAAEVAEANKPKKPALAAGALVTA